MDATKKMSIDQLSASVTDLIDKLKQQGLVISSDVQRKIKEEIDRLSNAQKALDQKKEDLKNSVEDLLQDRLKRFAANTPQPPQSSGPLDILAQHGESVSDDLRKWLNRNADAYTASRNPNLGQQNNQARQSVSDQNQQGGKRKSSKKSSKKSSQKSSKKSSQKQKKNSKSKSSKRQ